MFVFVVVVLYLLIAMQCGMFFDKCFNMGETLT